MLRPRDSFDQQILSARLTISPSPCEQRQLHDVFGNCVGLVRFGEAADTLRFDSELLVEHRPCFLDDADEACLASGAAFPFSYDAEEAPDLSRLIERSHPDPSGAVEFWARRFLRWNGRTPLLSLLADMTRAVHADFGYARRLEAGIQTPAETLALNTGTCRDFAVLMIEACRSLGLAARFVSGYIHTPPRKGERPHLGGGHTHAWVQVYLPASGWVDFDPTNGIVGNRDLVRVSVARDPRHTSPICGSWDGEAEDYLDMAVEVLVDSEPEALKAVG